MAAQRPYQRDLFPSQHRFGLAAKAKGPSGRAVKQPLAVMPITVWNPPAKSVRPPFPRAEELKRKDSKTGGDGDSLLLNAELSAGAVSSILKDSDLKRSSVLSVKRKTLDSVEKDQSALVKVPKLGANTHVDSWGWSKQPERPGCRPCQEGHIPKPVGRGKIGNHQRIARTLGKIEEALSGFLRAKKIKEQSYTGNTKPPVPKENQ